MNRTGTHHLLTAVLALLLTACDQRPVSPLRIGSNTWIGYEPVYLAREHGWIDSGHIRLVELNSASAVIEQIRIGQLDGGMLTLDEVLNLVGHGIPMKVVALLDLSNGADALLGREGMTLDTLEGRRIGVENTAVGAIMLDAALQDAGLSTDDIEIVPLEAHDHLAAWDHGRIDALVTFEPMRSRLVAQGARVLFDSRRIPDRIIDVLAIRADVDPRQVPHIEALLTAYGRALSAFEADPAASCGRMAPRLHIDPESLCRSYAGIEIPGLAGSREWLRSGRLDRRARMLAELMVDRRLLDGRVHIQGLADPRFIAP